MTSSCWESAARCSSSHRCSIGLQYGESGGRCSTVAASDSIKSRTTLHWNHNDYDRVSNHQPHGCLLNRLFRHRPKKTSKLRVTGLCAGNSPGPVNSQHKGPVTREMFPFDDVIMSWHDKQGWYYLDIKICLWMSDKPMEASFPPGCSRTLPQGH